MSGSMAAGQGRPALHRQSRSNHAVRDLYRAQSCCSHRQTAELRSAWTGEGARPHQSGA